VSSRNICNFGTADLPALRREVSEKRILMANKFNLDVDPVAVVICQAKNIVKREEEIYKSTGVVHRIKEK
jgi:hypothetical protein